MSVPGAAPLVFLAYLFLFLPWAALRSARRVGSARAAGRALPKGSSRTGTIVGILFLQIVLLFLAWRTGATFGYEIFALPPGGRIGVRNLALALAALAVCFVLRAVLRRLRSEDERRKLIVFHLAPRTPPEVALWVATVLVASVAEEAAYRGVGMSILWYSLDNPWLAALLCAVAFTLAHAVQGGKSAVLVFIVALVFHGLVALTGTLLLAMVTHAVYDLVAGWLIRREALRFDAEAAEAPEPAAT